MTAKHVARHFSEVSSEYGWPDTLLTDNGPCYASHEFKQLMLDMSDNHITSSAHYPQSNGLAEKYVQIVKTYSSKHMKKELSESPDDLQKHTPG